MLEVVRGKTAHQVVANKVANALAEAGVGGTLYIGYPILASADESVTVDAMLTGDEFGLVALIFLKDGLADGEWDSIRDEQDQLYFALDNHLGRHKALRSGRKLAIEINVITVLPSVEDVPEELEGKVCTPSTLAEQLDSLPDFDPKYLKALNAALQRISTIKPAKKRQKVQSEKSRGAVLKRIEREIANLDQWQKQAAIETPDGPQRIRGLAGSGKTIVLALKAAYLHAREPDWNIALTFYSRALYQQLVGLVRRFAFEHTNDEPNWDKLRVLHSWGGASRDGLYAEFANKSGELARDFAYAKSKYGMKDAFFGVCSDLLRIVESQQPEPVFDAVLIDEAQDLPWPFFRLIYHFTKPPKRIIWAYDELQHLSEGGMPNLEDMFGVGTDGKPRVEVVNIEGDPRSDIVLPVCYRNTPWALTLAHALGLGVYRKEGLVQHFDDPTLWEEVGYSLVNGELELGHNVTLQRAAHSYPKFFDDELEKDDAVVTRCFDDEEQQFSWIVSAIKKNLEEDELDPDDILVILPEALTAKSKSRVLFSMFARRRISCHLVGATSSQDQVFDPDSIAITNIYRAKGNEAPMIYVVNAQHCFSGYELITLRNTLFTSITRSRAWLRICGHGPEMGKLQKEIQSVVENDYRLTFKVPTAKELEKMRRLHGERTATDKAKIKKAEKGLREFLKALEEGVLSIENMPAELRTGLLKHWGDADEDAE